MSLREILLIAGTGITSLFGAKFWLARSEKNKINSESDVNDAKSIKLKAEAKLILAETDTHIVALYKNLVSQMENNSRQDKERCNQDKAELMQIIEANKKECERICEGLRRQIANK